MPDVFLSYNREDQAVARRFAQGLERAGFSVWWDATLNPGEAYDEVTEKALLEAKAVVVLWSPRSVVSRWVRAEATQADRNKTLLPVMIEPCTRPIMFELTQTADLSKWQGDENDAAWRAFIEGVRRFVTPGGGTTQTMALPPPPLPASPLTAPRRRNRASLLLAPALAAVLLIGGGIYWFSQRAPTAANPVATASVSLAVLPFADMSAEKDQEYFSDGLAEELLNELAQIKELRVAGRTSSFSFKGKNEDLRSIGTKLGVANILEGSVRKAGNRLRITAQLISAADGSHLWSNTYDRELSDIFAVQEEIAMAVTGALSVTLDVGAMSRANGGTTNVAAYDKYLQAQALYYQGALVEVFQRASQLYRDAVALDPEFARAWYGLNRSNEQETVFIGGDLTSRRQEMSAAKERLEALAPQAWFTQTLRATDFMLQRKWSEAEATARAALAASPRPETALTYGTFLERVGRAREAEGYIRRAAEAEPLSVTMSQSLWTVLDIAGRPEEAQAEYLRGRALGTTGIVGYSFALYRTWSRKPPDKAAVESALRALIAVSRNSSVMSSNGGHLGVTLDNWDDRPAALAAVREDLAHRQSASMLFAPLADHYGDKDMIFATLKRLVETNAPQILALWQFNESGWRSDPRYKQLLRELGLVDYYRKSGKWPDFCKPVGADDFECS